MSESKKNLLEKVLKLKSALVRKGLKVKLKITKLITSDSNSEILEQSRSV